MICLILNWPEDMGTVNFIRHNLWLIISSKKYFIAFFSLESCQSSWKLRTTVSAIQSMKLHDSRSFKFIFKKRWNSPRASRLNIQQELPNSIRNHDGARTYIRSRSLTTEPIQRNRIEFKSSLLNSLDRRKFFVIIPTMHSTTRILTEYHLIILNQTRVI